MTTMDIAKMLVKYCRKGDFKTAVKELYADDAVSIEPEATGGYAKETKGKTAILQKGEHFASSVEEYYSTTTSEPLVAANSIAFTLTMEIKMKGQEKMTMSEICVYTVKNDKIILEEFFW